METNVAEITKKDVVAAKSALKVLTNAWAKRIAEKMFGSEPDFDEDKSLSRVYNIINGIVRSQDSRRNFMLAANELKAELELEQQKALEALEEIKK